MTISRTTLIAFVALLIVLVWATEAQAKTTPYERWAVNKCHRAVHVFRHPFKGTVVAKPTRSWCTWTMIALRRKDNPRAGYAASPELAKLVRLESGYFPGAANPTSTAFGLYQFLNTTWPAYGCQRTTNPVQQSVCGIRYIQRRYRSPRAAFQFHLKNNWY